MVSKAVSGNQEYPPVLPDIRQWPIYQLSRQRQEILRTCVHQTLENLEKSLKPDESLNTLIAEAAWLEKNRIKTNPWSIDPEDEKEFWAAIRDRLPQLDEEEEVRALTEGIVWRYSNEIIGHFNPGTYQLARRIVDSGFAKLLNARVRRIRHPKSGRKSIYDKIRLVGDIELVRKLALKGTLVFVPTHLSNLDSLALGWAIKSMGLPAFFYGAGLNLFNIRLMAYFMNQLGAYKVDRRKKNRIYLESLKTYSTLLMQRGGHSLFFPGGTRNRSGRLENRLKLGLLSTTIEAQRLNLLDPENTGPKIFVVPIVLSYHFVLEAPILINEYLKATGKEKYFSESDPYTTSYKIFKFVIKFFLASSELALSLAPPMDVFGNRVDENGISYDHNGKPLDISGYFQWHGKPVEDRQRDFQFTRLLSEKIVEAYRNYNYVLTSHMLAFTAFTMIEKDNPRMDLYDILRLSVKDITFDYTRFRNNIIAFREHLIQKEKNGEIILSPEARGDVDELIAHGMKNLGVYHALHPLKMDRKKRIRTESLANLYYYHNRLDAYDFKKYIH